jgi:hypothetical protein
MENFEKIYGPIYKIHNMVECETFLKLDYEILESDNKIICKFLNRNKLYSIHECIKVDNMYYAKYIPYLRNLNNSGRRFNNLYFCFDGSLDELDFRIHRANELYFSHLRN